MIEMMSTAFDCYEHDLLNNRMRKSVLFAWRGEQSGGLTSHVTLRRFPVPRVKRIHIFQIK